MAEEMDGEEFVVDKILDKRVRNGKIEYYLSWKVKILDQSYIIMKFGFFRDLVQRRTHGSPKRISTVLNLLKHLKIN